MQRTIRLALWLERKNDRDCEVVHRIIGIYEAHGIVHERVLIKLASTSAAWRRSPDGFFWSLPSQAGGNKRAVATARTGIAFGALVQRGNGHLIYREDVESQ